MRLVLVGVLVAAVGCSNGQEAGDYRATGGADAGATGGAGGQASGTAGAASGGASGNCNIPLGMVNGNVTGATSMGTAAGSGPLPEVTACASAGSGVAQSAVKVIDGQPNGESDWTETSLAITSVDGGCAASIGYTRVGISYDGGITCNETLSVQLTVPPQ